MSLDAVKESSEKAGIRVLSTSVLMPRLGILQPADLAHPREALELDFKSRLGRKGLRYSTEATLLALAAVSEVLETGSDVSEDSRRHYSLVAASAYGNYRATCGSASQLVKHGVNHLSPMDLPNASSNIMASQIAIRFGIKGICLTADDGLNSGESVLRWASLLLRTGRCERVVAVVSESPSEFEHLLRGGRPLITGAIALLLASDDGGSSELPTTDFLPEWTLEFELASLRGLTHVACGVTAASS